MTAEVEILRDAYTAARFTGRKVLGRCSVTKWQDQVSSGRVHTLPRARTWVQAPSHHKGDHAKGSFTSGGEALVSLLLSVSLCLSVFHPLSGKKNKQKRVAGSDGILQARSPSRKKER